MAFKRGFLNSKKGRDALALDEPTSIGPDTPISPEPTQNTTQEETGKSPSSEAESGSSTPSVDETKSPETPLDLHAVPPWLNSRGGRQRYVFREWRRAPDGQVYGKEHLEFGKRTSNGWNVWGETLWDFFRIERIPTSFCPIVTFSSGSRIAAWMRSYGELDAAVDELAWTDSEGDPEQIYPCDVGQLIHDYETSFRFFGGTVPKLQARLPFHLLPQKLIVHDPWNTLSARSTRNDDDAPKGDVVHTYELSLSEEGKKKQLAEREAAEAADKARLEEDEWRVILPDFEEPGPLPPDRIAIHAKLPPRPARPTSIPEAHLHIRREDLCGSGNHSKVYFSELVLPRWTFIDDQLCEECFQIALREEVEERTKAGTLIPEDAKGKGEPPEIKITSTVAVNRRNLVLDTEPIDKSKHPASAQANEGSTTICNLRASTYQANSLEYRGPIGRVYPKVSWQNPERGPLCDHLRGGGPNPPRTSRVKVCAKLSIQGDLHLAREAENYQAFPSHFFEHWNGYNIVHPIHDPTPCGALVPQFYGYYIPKEGFKPVIDDVVDTDTASAPGQGAKVDNSSHLPRDYLSPILMLEHCGVPVRLDDLSIDDKNTCAALHYLFLEGGWTQGSVAERNVVVQPGPLTEWPVFRGMDGGQSSFRLIDFGRATQPRRDIDFDSEKNEVTNLFRAPYFGLA